MILLPLNQYLIKEKGLKNNCRIKNTFSYFRHKIVLWILLKPYKSFSLYIVFPPYIVAHLLQYGRFAK